LISFKNLKVEKILGSFWINSLFLKSINRANLILLNITKRKR